MVGAVTKTLVVASYLGTLAVNILANTLPINNITTGAVSDSYPNLFAPAGISFSIWGVIYLLLGLFVLYTLGVFKDVTRQKKVIDQVSEYFIISSVANMLWIFSWHYDQILASMFFMIVILVCLVKIASALGRRNLRGKEYIFLELPFSVYFGWITVATIANVTVLLVSIGWGGFGLSDAFWTVAVIAIGTVIGIWRMAKDKSIAYGLVFIWAYLGILIKHTSAAGFGYAYPSVILAASICILAFLGCGIAFTVKKKSSFLRLMPGKKKA